MEWNEVKPVLDATYRLLADQDYIPGQAVAQALGRPPDDERIGRILEQLHRAGYIEGQFVMQTSMPVMISPTEKGLQESSGWPAPGASAQVDLLLQLLDERIADASTPEEEKGRLRRAREAIGGLGREVLAEVLAAYVARVGGLS
jgi:hypothetical protein